ncbi:MAG: ABC transporter ATP-binding protein [Slackia sp.]|nr:ABC transporter ATP-binding protein [Slackia sp.]
MTKRFADSTVFDDASFSFEHGKIHCIMGVSGGGKTTLLRMLMGLEAPDEGRIEGMDGLRSAAVFQENRLCENLSVAANIRMPHAGLKGARKDAFLARCDALLASMGMPDSLARPAHELSGGMKRRVAIARAVLADADVLFFDEALKGLDPETEQRVMDAIVPLLAGKTVFWTTHRAQELRYFESPLLTRIEDLR